MLTVLAVMLRRFTLVRQEGVEVKPKLAFVLKPNVGGVRLVVRASARSSR